MSGRDLASMAAAFGECLREAGAPMSVDQVGRFVRGVALSTPATLDELYHVGRATLVVDREHLVTYDRVFNQVFRNVVDFADSRGDDNAPPPANDPSRQDHGRPGPAAPSAPGGSHPSVGEQGGDQGEERETDVAFASAEERLSTTDFGELSDDELRELRRLMARVRIRVPLRPARRRRRHPHGDRLDLRATLRRSRRTGGDPIGHVARSPRLRPRKVVVLCDISGSMAPYSRACIQLLHAAAGGSRAEVFSFATRLTRLTLALKAADPDVALAKAAVAAPDWKSGTRIGSGLKEFLDGYGRRGAARGAVVVVVSDGWDCGDPALVDEQMARLGRLAHRVVWINPRRTAAGFVPLAGGMAAALPYCDALVGGNTLSALCDAMGSLTDEH